MRVALLLLFLVVSAAQYSRASGGPVIHIKTESSGIQYRLVSGTVEPEKEVASLEEVGVWISARLKSERDKAVLIYADEHASFRVVLDLIRQLKAAGVELYSVGVVNLGGGKAEFQCLSGNTSLVR